MLKNISSLTLVTITIFFCFSCQSQTPKTKVVPANQESTETKSSSTSSESTDTFTMHGEKIFEGPLPHKGKKVGFAHGFMDKIEGGGVTGRTNPKYKGHAANYAVRLDHEDANYQFEIKIHDENSTGGIRVGYHMASCSIGLNYLSVDKKKVPHSLSAGKWYTVNVARRGKMVSLKIGDTVVTGENAKLKPMIDAIRLTVKGTSKTVDAKVSYRNLKICKAKKG